MGAWEEKKFLGGDPGSLTVSFVTNAEWRKNPSPYIPRVLFSYIYVFPYSLRPLIWETKLDPKVGKGYRQKASAICRHLRRSDVAATFYCHPAKCRSVVPVDVHDRYNRTTIAPTVALFFFVSVQFPSAQYTAVYITKTQNDMSHRFRRAQSSCNISFLSPPLSLFSGRLPLPLCRTDNAIRSAELYPIIYTLCATVFI